MFSGNTSIKRALIIYVIASGIAINIAIAGVFCLVLYDKIKFL